MDKAGAYAVQGLPPSISKISGSYSGVMGPPVARNRQALLRQSGFALWGLLTAPRAMPLHRLLEYCRERADQST